MKGMSDGLLKIHMKSNLPKPPPTPMEPDSALDIIRFPCCNETIKVTRHDHHFCIICGAEIDMSTSDSRKVFLSHKGVDKGYVTELKKHWPFLATIHGSMRMPCQLARL